MFVVFVLSVADFCVIDLTLLTPKIKCSLTFCSSLTVYAIDRLILTGKMAFHILATC